MKKLCVGLPYFPYVLLRRSTSCAALINASGWKIARPPCCHRRRHLQSTPTQLVMGFFLIGRMTSTETKRQRPHNSQENAFGKTRI